MFEFVFIDVSVCIKPVEEAAYIGCGVHLVQRAGID